MKKSVFMIVILLALTAGVINAVMDKQFTDQYLSGEPILVEKFALSDCVQDGIWILVASISGISLFFAPYPAINLLKRIAPKKATKANIYILGAMLLASVPLTIYSTFFVGTRGCKAFFDLCCK